MRLIGYAMVALFFFGVGVMVGEHVIKSAYREMQMQYYVPTKGEGFETMRIYSEEYNKQAHRLR